MWKRKGEYLFTGWNMIRYIREVNSGKERGRETWRMRERETVLRLLLLPHFRILPTEQFSIFRNVHICRENKRERELRYSIYHKVNASIPAAALISYLVGSINHPLNEWTLFLPSTLSISLSNFLRNYFPIPEINFLLLSFPLFLFTALIVISIIIFGTISEPVEHH